MMDSRRALEEPPALPPKLYKTHRKELRKDFPVRSPVPPKESSSNHSATKTPTPKPPRLDYRRHGENRLLNIDVSDLRGKSRDEIVLMLLQLKREKANLNRWRHYFEEELTRLTPAAEADPKARREFDDLCLKLKDVEGQLAASVPLINFMNKIIRMNDLYASDEEPFASEYEKPNRSSSRRKSFEFVRRLEEKEVAQALEEGMSRSNTPPLPTRSLGIVTSAELFRRKRQQSVQSRVNLEDYPEDFSIRSRRLQLEEELRQLDELWKEASSIRTVSESAPRPTAPYSSSVNSRRQQTPVTKRVALRRCDQTEAVRPRSESSAYVPRRSTKLRPRSDLISSFSADLDRRALSQLDVALDYPASPHAYRSQRP
ncbi:unnamed protein product [Mesocestoides corti]|nr:unnamed protein product [Mesocestoides corti]